MKLFVGLGNPGAKYEKTRHNIGFMAVEAIGDRYGFAPFRAKFQGELTEGKLGVEKVFLLKPQTFMNLSGQSVGEAMRYFKLTPEDVAVFHDELDLGPGKVKVKRGGGHAGHNGLRSMHEHIGEAYQRVRLGIGHPGDKRKVSGYVLHDFAKADWDWIDPLMQGIADGAPLLAAEDASGFMNKIALQLQPLKEAAKADKAKPPEQKKADPKPTAVPTDAPAPEEAGGSMLDRLLAKYRK
ncbi:MAG: aminoacyl-tRNA hydrolase [Pseudomonadota bacterium]